MRGDKRAFRRLLPPVALALLIAGCATQEELFRQRVAERPAAIQALSLEDQARLRRGAVQPGDTKDAVWLARGDPTRVNRRVTAGRTNEVWSYAFLVREPGAMMYPYATPRPVVLPNGGVAWVRDPVWLGNESVREVEYLRVEFESDRAVAVETPQSAYRAQP